jgi:hypothetical protein
MGFPKHLADGEVLNVGVNREELPKLRGGPRITVISKREGHHFKLE